MLYDERSSLCNGLRVLLPVSGMTAAIEQADDAQAGLRMVADLVAPGSPVLVWLDAGLPGGPTSRALQRLDREWPQVHRLVTVHTLGQERRARAGGADHALLAGFKAEASFGVLTQLRGLPGEGSPPLRCC